MEAELEWTRAQTTAALSIALLVPAAGAITAGRWVDRGHARRMMTAGSCVATLLVLVWARADGLPAFYVTWAAIGVTMAALLGATTIPMHALLLRGRPEPDGEPGVAPATRTATFWFLAAAFVIQAFAHVSVSVHAVPMLIEWGHGPGFAASVAGLVGAMQVAGRLCSGRCASASPPAP